MVGCRKCVHIHKCRGSNKVITTNDIDSDATKLGFTKRCGTLRKKYALMLLVVFSIGCSSPKAEDLTYGKRQPSLIELQFVGSKPMPGLGFDRDVQPRMEMKSMSSIIAWCESIYTQPLIYYMLYKSQEYYFLLLWNSTSPISYDLIIYQHDLLLKNSRTTLKAVAKKVLMVTTETMQFSFIFDRDAGTLTVSDSGGRSFVIGFRTDGRLIGDPATPPPP